MAAIVLLGLQRTRQCAYSSVDSSGGWTVPLTKNEYEFFTTPLLLDDQIFISSSEKIYAINQASGEIQWSAKPDRNKLTGLATDGARVLASHGTAGILAYDPDTGEQTNIRNIRLGESNISVGSDAIYLSTRDGMNAIDPSSGETIWTASASDSGAGDRDTEPIVLNDSVLFISGSQIVGAGVERDSPKQNNSTDNSTQTVEGGTTIFRRFRGDSALPIGVIGGGILGGIGIAAYRRLQSDTDDATSVSANTNSEETAIAESSSSKPVEEEGYTESTYADYEQDVELRQTEYLNVTVASIDDYADVAFYTSAHNNSETVDKALADELASGFETWSKVDDHENILTVCQHSDTPTSWAAVELADYMFDPADFADESVVTKRDLIVDLCNAVYEGHRYGLAHGGLGVSTFASCPLWLKRPVADT